MDLSKISKPFGDLDQETQWAMKGAASDGYLFQLFHYPENSWETFKPTGLFSHTSIYRLKPEPVKMSRTFKMGVAAYPHSEPLISAGHYETDGWHKGDVTVEFVDGSPVKITWEAKQ